MLQIQMKCMRYWQNHLIILFIYSLLLCGNSSLSLWRSESAPLEPVPDLPVPDFTLVNAETRNIILVGKSRSGKSTIINVLKNATHDPADMDILRGTVDAKISSFTLTGTEESMHFNIMDTPGLFERATTVNETRKNKIISDLILKCVDLEFTKINHVYFVMNFIGGLSKEDVQSFEIFRELFVGMEDKTSIILTFAERFEEKHRQHYRTQFQKTPALIPIYKAINGRIFFLGASKGGKFMNLELLQQNVAQQRRELILHIMNQTEQYNVKNLPMYKNNLEGMKNFKKNLTECCRCEHTCLDMEVYDAFLQHYSQGTEELKQTEETQPTIAWEETKDEYAADQDEIVLAIKYENI